MDRLTEFGPLILLGIAVTVLLWSSTRWIKGKRSLSDAESRRRAKTNLTATAKMQSNMQDLMLELEGLARHISAEIDTRFCKLEVLIEQADERIARLESLSKAAGGSDSESTEPIEEVVDPERAMIYKLADTGKSVAQIASAVGKHAGEIELILSLRRTEGGGKIDYTVD